MTKTKAEQALELWKEWFARDGDPVCVSECGGDAYCFFCSEWWWGGEETHESDCIFVRARQLVKES